MTEVFFSLNSYKDWLCLCQDMDRNTRLDIPFPLGSGCLQCTKPVTVWCLVQKISKRFYESFLKARDIKQCVQKLSLSYSFFFFFLFLSFSLSSSRVWMYGLTKTYSLCAEFIVFSYMDLLTLNIFVIFFMPKQNIQNHWPAKDLQYRKMYGCGQQQQQYQKHLLTHIIILHIC